ncbi:winged helix-turn-helix domain-containing protein [Gordonia sputi]
MPATSSKTYAHLRPGSALEAALAFPEYAEVETPLLCLIYGSGGQIEAREAYEPLADYFGLSVAERSEMRTDGRREPRWNNMVQWARRKLNDQGYLERAGHGVWKLSSAGMDAANTAQAGTLRSLRV